MRPELDLLQFALHDPDQTVEIGDDEVGHRPSQQ